MNPYFVLGVSPDADDAAIRQAYVDAVKRSPPELDPDGFQRARTAYDEIKDEGARHRYVLFGDTIPGESPVDVFVRHVRIRHRPHPLPLGAMKELLRACSKS